MSVGRRRRTFGVRTGLPALLSSSTTAWTLTRDSGGPAWDAGAYSSLGVAGNGRMQVTLAAGRDFMFGLSSSNVDAGYTSINYAMYVGPNDVTIFEMGVQVYNSVGLATGAEGSLFAVARTGTTVTYTKDGATFYTSLTTTAVQLFGDCTIYNGGTAMSGVRLYGPGLLATSWVDLVGVTASPA